MFVCLFVCPLIAQKPHHRFASSFNWGSRQNPNVSQLGLKHLKLSGLAFIQKAQYPNKAGCQSQSMIYWLVCYLLVCLIFSIQLTLRRGIFVETQIIFPIKVYTAGLSLPLSLNKYYKHFGNLPLKTLKTLKH